VLTGGAGGRALALAFEQLFGIRDAFAGIPVAGRTDTRILADAMAAHGIDPNDGRARRFQDAYLIHLVEEIAKPGSRKGVMPGVRQLLGALTSPTSSDHFQPFVALLTGNYEAGARVKLEYFDLWRYFRCGAFGDEAPDRNGLLAVALARVSAFGPSFLPSDTVIIGDTPLDIECARLGGARSIGVATGSHQVDELRRAGADVAVEDLGDTRAVLRAIQGFQRRGP
jgi:phosphoglycolate phosphatase-like HAD superfamily hydrolase